MRETNTIAAEIVELSVIKSAYNHFLASHEGQLDVENATYIRNNKAIVCGNLKKLYLELEEAKGIRDKETGKSQKAQATGKEADSILQVAEKQNTKLQVPNNKTQIPNTKLQVPNTKLQVPNTKLQVPNNKLQVPNNKTQIPNGKQQTINYKLQTVNKLQTDENPQPDTSNTQHTTHNLRMKFERYHATELEERAILLFNSDRRYIITE